jgi:hypothetical protein
MHLRLFAAETTRKAAVIFGGVPTWMMAPKSLTKSCKRFQKNIALAMCQAKM